MDYDYTNYKYELQVPYDVTYSGFLMSSMFMFTSGTKTRLYM